MPGTLNNVNGASPEWTDVEMGTLLLEVEKPKYLRRSFSQLAKALPGRSRNAIAGKMQRLGLSIRKYRLTNS
jgi:hypothetical protein